MKMKNKTFQIIIKITNSFHFQPQKINYKKNIKSYSKTLKKTQAKINLIPSIAAFNKVIIIKANLIQKM